MIEKITYKEQDNASALKLLKAVRHYILTANQIYHSFWNRDPHKILENLNENVELYLERFHTNTIIGTVMNTESDKVMASLEPGDSNYFTDRVIVKMPDTFAYDSEAGQFTYTPVAVIVPVPEPEVVVEPVEQVIEPAPVDEIVEEPDDEIA